MNIKSIKEFGVQPLIIAFGIVILAGVYIGLVPILYPENDPIPVNITGDLRVAYAFAKTEKGNELLEQIPCYCGCKNIEHKHTRDCFWNNNGEWDKHGVRCRICVEIAMNTKLMHEDGKNVCEIREKIDSHYERIAEYSTETPMPEGC